ncbi:TonB-linked SusC/RagA family outer membrane protein [Mucilaginibacter sp. UYP25]|uniref:SusC/RagA family TonB-linked outer membrane protein n=1 Tax=unclassified Mucilaginibacter TaxID=2617802 RepID=UPI003397584B
MKKKFLLILFLPGVTCGAYAANHNVGSIKGNFGLHVRATGNASTAAPIKVTVRDNTGQPLPGVTVKIKGTGIGGQTDVNGAVTINAQIGDILVFSYIGYVTQEAKLITGADLSIALAEDSKVLGEVVVTALGIKKERRSLGYSVSEVKGEDLTKAREPNFVNALVGKVAGVNVSNMSGGPGASTNILIRGVSSISQTNQPLYVVNGVPIESQPGGVASYLSGKGNNNGGSQYDNSSDNGDAISNINPDDIESISVLKGAAAAALYGSRAKAGVILITTKTAKSNSVEFNSNYVAETIIDPTHWQYQYGQGATNTAPKTLQEAFQSGQSSYGAPFSSTTSAVQFDGVIRPYTAQKGNLDKFYRTGNTLTNTVAFNKMFDGGSVRLSASDMHNNSVVPNSGLNRQTFDLNGSYDINKHLVINARANYILEQGNNRPYVGDGAGNPNFNAWFLPTSVDINTLKGVNNGSIANGNEYGYSANTYATNPWFAAQNFVNNTKRVRLLSNVSLRYNFDGGAFIQGRVGSDTYNDRITGIVPTGTAYRLNGSISEESTNVKDITADVLIGKPFKINSDFTITPNAGASYRRTRSESIVNGGDNFAVPFVYNLTNAISNKSVSYYPGDLETQAVYGTLEVSYKNLLYITGTGRNDWFSTLATPGKDNKLGKFYPAISGAFIFSELWHPSWLSNGKLRAGYAGVGQATTPFQTQLSYNLNSAILNGLPLGGIANDAVPNNSLIASYASEIEIGAELGFLNNRITVDMAWYNKKSKDEIVKAPASASSGYSAAVLNIGKLQNKGFELLINGTPFKSSTFTWASSFNGSVNTSKVIELATGTNRLLLATSRSGVGFTQQVAGLPANQVMAYDYAYDASGNIAIDPNTGLPSKGELKAYGSAYAKWIAGFSNTFTYKSLSLSVLVDGKWGGKIFSTTDYYGYVFGLHEATTINRLGNFGTTAKPTNAATYYNNLANNVSKLFVQDASFIKFRSVTLGYTLPANLFKGAVKSATISLVGRNLFYIMKKTDNIDPESSYSAFAQGIESGGLPTTRTYGLNLSVKF